MDAFKNFAKGIVSTGYDASAVSIVLTAGHGARFASVPFNAVWWNSTDYPDPSDDPNVEVVRVTGISTDTLTITRAQEGTSASAKDTGGKTYKILAGLTARTLNEDLNPASAYGETTTKTAVAASDFNATTPTNSEGYNALTLAPLTLKRATSKVKLEGVIYLRRSVSFATVKFMVFRGGTPVYSGLVHPIATTLAAPGPIFCEDLPGSVGPHTYELRYGAASGTISLNGITTAGTWEYNFLKTTLKATEVFV